jgi:hypothetical protein
MQQSRAPSEYRPASRAYLKVPLPHLARRTTMQRGRKQLKAAASDPADLGLASSVPVLMTRSLESEECPAIKSADGGSSGASTPTATRRQLDQLFGILATEKNILTAQCWSSADYREFAAPIYDHNVEAIGCCYFAISEPTMDEEIVRYICKHAASDILGQHDASLCLNAHTMKHVWPLCLCNMHIEDDSSVWSDNGATSMCCRGKKPSA